MGRFLLFAQSSISILHYNEGRATACAPDHVLFLSIQLLLPVDQLRKTPLHFIFQLEDVSFWTLISIVYTCLAVVLEN